MARAIYSQRFIAQQALTAGSAIVTVPAGMVYVVKQLTVYGNTLLSWHANFRCVNSGETRFSFGDSGGRGAWGGFYGALVFESGEQFQWQAVVQVGDSVDVYAGGYVLTQ